MYHNMPLSPICPFSTPTQLRQVKTFSYSWLARTSSSQDQVSKDAISGFVASVVACSLVYPLDSAKVRLQAGKEAVPSPKEGGPFALYSGLLLNLGREAPNAAPRHRFQGSLHVYTVYRLCLYVYILCRLCLYSIGRV